MHSLTYVTGNATKFRQAAKVCEQAGVTLNQVKLHIPEVQAADGETVACDKAAKAFAELQQPLVVSDDSWMIPGLGGFPGPYMKYMNDWLTGEDWLRLTRELDDRRVVVQQVVVYQDAMQQKVFSVDIPGILLRERRGASPFPHCELVSFDGGKHTNAEYHELGQSAAEHHANVWHKFAEWYRERQ